MVLKITNNHHRIPHFYEKVEKILQYFKKEISAYYSNIELINIFVGNKRVLLFLIKEKMLTVDRYFVIKITTGKYIETKYPQYFAPEIKPFMNESWFLKKQNYNDILIEEIEKDLPKDFELNRQN